MVNACFLYHCRCSRSPSEVKQVHSAPALSTSILCTNLLRQNISIIIFRFFGSASFARKLETRSIDLLHVPLTLRERSFYSSFSIWSFVWCFGSSFERVFCEAVTKNRVFIFSKFLLKLSHPRFAKKNKKGYMVNSLKNIWGVGLLFLEKIN